MKSSSVIQRYRRAKNGLAAGGAFVDCLLLTEGTEGVGVTEYVQAAFVILISTYFSKTMHTKMIQK